MSSSTRPRGRPGPKPKGSVPVLAAEPSDRLDPDGLTPRQRQVLAVIENFSRRRCYPPSLREIGEEVGLVPSAVSYQLANLREMGYLSLDPGQARTAVVRIPGHQAIGHYQVAGANSGQTDATPIDTGSREQAYVPLVGQIAAGGPIDAEQSVEDIFQLPRQLVGEGSLFLLRVAGDSMINAAITDGDWVVVREQPKAENGEIVAAMIDGVGSVAEATVKTYRRSDDHVWLMPHNPAYPPIPGDTATILGKVVAVLRRV
jgi:repressor LexA